MLGIIQAIHDIVSGVPRLWLKKAIDGALVMAQGLTFSLILGSIQWVKCPLLDRISSSYLVFAFVIFLFRERRGGTLIWLTVCCRLLLPLGF